MNCPECSTPMLWVGTFSRGKMECPHCDTEPKIIVDFGRIKSAEERVDAVADTIFTGKIGVIQGVTIHEPFGARIPRGIDLEKDCENVRWLTEGRPLRVCGISSGPDPDQILEKIRDENLKIAQRHMEGLRMVQEIQAEQQRAAQWFAEWDRKERENVIRARWAEVMESAALDPSAWAEAMESAALDPSAMSVISDMVEKSSRPMTMPPILMPRSQAKAFGIEIVEEKPDGKDA